jgi:fibronectin type 3 domain-containing protein
MKPHSTCNSIPSQTLQTTIVAAFGSILLSGCLQGARNPATTTSASSAALVLVTYDTSTATLLAKGDVTRAGGTDSSVVRFFTNEECTGSSVGQGLFGFLKSTGIEVKLPSSTPNTLHYRIVGFPECTLFAKYQANYQAPPPPLMTKTSPASPSRVSYTPAVYGTTSGVTATVQIFDDASCSHQVGADVGGNFPLIGIQVALAPNAINSLYAKSVEPFGKASACTLLGTYTHTQIGPPPPVFAAIAPTSPNNSSLTPIVSGTASTDSVNVKVFSDPACSTIVASGTATLFTSTGLQTSVTADTTTPLYAMAYDADNNPSVCNYLHTYKHDSVPPAAPTFIDATPASPTNATIYPLIRGLSSSDTATVRIFRDAGCIQQIGSDSKTAFEGAGVRTSASPNATISLYAAAIDDAGNASTCTYFSSYWHNTIPPEPPVFGTTDPISPNNQSITPLISGGIATGTAIINFYTDDQCTLTAGSGTGPDFANAGILITMPPNAITRVFAQPIDVMGNIGACTELTTYAHSTLPAPNPGFQLSIPASPSRISYRPTIVGTAAITVSIVRLYSNGVCTNLLAQGARAQFITAGFQVTLPQRATSSIYGLATDVYGNDSACVLLTQFTHDDVAPLNPVLVSVLPLSPNNTSTTPSVKGTVNIDPLKVLPPTTVIIYDSFLCINTLGTGTVADFVGAGITSSVPANALTNLHGRSFDAAGNYSGCTTMSDYVHETRPPGKPILSSANPASPSYTQTTTLTGTLGTSSSLMPATLIGYYSDSSCATQIGTGLPNIFISPGVAVTPYNNQTTSIYGRTFDAIGNQSICNSLLTYVHSSTGATGPSATLNPDGSVLVGWVPDTTANPLPQYIVKRSLTPSGPYTAISIPLWSTSYSDRAVANNTTYYYVIAATNSTGTSLDTAEVSKFVSVTTPAAATNLTATPGRAEIKLDWTGFSSDNTYTVLRAQQSGGPYTVVKAGLLSKNHIDKSLVNGTVYYYVVRGVNPWGESVQSTEANAMPLSTGLAPTTLTLAPLNRGGPCTDGTGIILSWSSPQYYDGFNLRRSSTTGVEFTYLNLPVGTNTHVECPPSNGGGDNEYNFYTVVGTWGGDESPNSNEVAIAAIPPPTLTARGGATLINLSWPVVNQATGFAIYRASRSGGPYVQLQSNYATNSYDDPVDGVNVILGKTYYYYIQAHFPDSAIGYPSLEASSTPDTDPAAPSNLIVLKDPTRAPALYWSAPKNFNRFNIYRSSSFGGPYVFVGSTPTNVNINSFIDSSAPTGLWYYQVRAQWGSFETAPVTSSPPYRHGFPSFVTATPGAANIALSWTAVSGAVNYRVYRATTSKGTTTLLGSPATNSFTDSTALASTGYFYTVDAVFADTTAGEMSAEVSAMRTGSTVPTGLTVTSTTSSSISLTWAKVPGASQYKVYKSGSIGGVYTLVSTVSTNTALAASGMLSGVTYYLKVASVISGTESAKSVATSGTTYDYPFAPSVKIGSSSTEICWLPVTGATSYTINRSTDGINFAAIATGATSCPLTDVSATNGILYFYTVTAVFPSGAQTISSTSSGVTPGVTPLVPNGLTLVGNSSGISVSLSWSFITGATGYMVYISTTSGSGFTPALVGPVASNKDVVISSLTSGTTYYFTVASVNGLLASAQSPEIAVTISATPPAPSATVLNNAVVEVSWAPLAGAIVYDLQRSTDGVSFETLPASPVTSPYSDNTAVAGVGYFYRYLPYTDVGRLIPMAASSASNPIVTLGNPPRAPTQLIAYAASAASVNLIWGLTPNASKYRIYRSTTGVPGSFTLINTITTDLFYMPTFATDGTVLPATTYFYVVAAVNTSGVESALSNMASVSINIGAAGLLASLGTNTIELSWTPVGGASSYTLRRGISAGGPYGVVATGLATTSYSDATVEHGIQYYYVVNAITATGESLPDSNETNAVAQVIMNLQVPVELTDQGLSSQTIPVTFERTRTTLNTAYYDGTVTYALELNATNTDTNPQVVALLDANNATVATLAVAAGVSSPYRSRTVFTPTAGASSYRLQLPATTANAQLQVHSARILITQVGASRTRLYFPLLSSLNGASSGDATSTIESTSAMIFATLNSGTLFRRETLKYSKLADVTPWELETIVASDPGVIGSVALIKESNGQTVLGTQGYLSSTTVTLIRAPFSEGTSQFDSTTEGQNFQVSIRCEFNCASGSVKLYKAGLWLTLKQITKLRIPFRIGFGLMGASTTAQDNERTRIDTTAFSNPSFDFQSVATVSAPNTMTAALSTAGTDDQGTTTITPIAGSNLVFSSPTKTLARTSSGLTLANGDRFLPLLTPGAMTTYKLIDATVLVDAQK